MMTRDLVLLYIPSQTGYTIACTSAHPAKIPNAHPTANVLKSYINESSYTTTSLTLADNPIAMHVIPSISSSRCGKHQIGPNPFRLSEIVTAPSSKSSRRDSAARHAGTSRLCLMHSNAFKNRFLEQSPSKRTYICIVTRKIHLNSFHDYKKTIPALIFCY